MIYQFYKLKSFNLWLLVPLVLFTFLFLPFIETPTCWDAATEASFVQIFYTRGVKEYSQISIAHPFFKPFLTSIFYKIGGFSIISYNLVGFIAGCLGIIGIYLLSRSLFNRNVGLISSLLLSTSPVFVANSVNNLNDCLMTNLIIVALYFYIKNRLFLYIITISMAILTKETAGLLPVAVLIIECAFSFRKKQLFKRITFIKLSLLLLPLFSLLIWNKFAEINGRPSSWTWMLGESAYMKIVRNLVTFNIFTQYTKVHISKLLFLNFNWIYWIIVVAGGTVALRNIGLKKLKEHILTGGRKEKTLLIIFLFVTAYVSTVLTLQIPSPARYHLPVIPFLLIGVSFMISIYIARMPIFLILLFSTVSFLGLFFSIDPISIKLWNHEWLEGQHVYSKSIGDDELVYNLQYLFIVKQRGNTIHNVQNSKIILSEMKKQKSNAGANYCNFRNGMFP